MADIKEAFLDESHVRVAVVGYKDHIDSPNVQFLDFTSSTNEVHRFLDTLSAMGGDDLPEDVLGGVRQALNASWKQQTRCVIHIADAPPHGRVLHDLRETQDDYPEPGSEPHGLRYESLIRQAVQLNVNYALLRINSTTDRMALAFSQIYAAADADIKLLPSNTYHRIEASAKGSVSAVLQFEELQLGTTYSELRHLVVRSVTGSVSRTTNRLTMTLTQGSKGGSTTGGNASKLPSNLKAINEEISLEGGPPQWSTPGWLDETLVVEGFCPDVVVHSASTLNDMMAADGHIRLSIAELTIHARSRPFAQGSLRVASYARTAVSSSPFVVKSFKEDGKGQAHLAEDMRIQALCKAFALEFNELLETEEPIDFVVTMCLQKQSRTSSKNKWLSLEPFLEGEYVKYNNNQLFVREDSPDDLFNRKAQAFSHFTFERSWGHFLVTDLQGVGNLLTDPAVQTLDHERFKLNPTNLNEAGFKFFFVGHECNEFCHKLGLKSNREMVVSGRFSFRERWPTMDPTVCCSNKLCRRIIRLASAQKSPKYPGFHWCNACWPQLVSSTVNWICVAPGPNHEFEVSRFFHESQVQAPPRRCAEHLEKDMTVSSAAVVGRNIWNRTKLAKKKSSIVGSSW